MDEKTARDIPYGVLMEIEPGDLSLITPRGI
jgi:hypothetical protein